MRTTLIIAMAATLVGCNHKPSYHAAVSYTNESGFVCVNRTAFTRPIAARGSSNDSKDKTANRRSQRNKARVGYTTTKPVKPASQPSVTHTPLAPTLQLNLNSGAAARPIAAELDVADSASRADTLSLNRGSRSMAAASAASEQKEAAGVRASRDNEESLASVSLNNLEPLVAIVLARPEIDSVSDLTGKNISIDEKYSASSADLRIAIVAAGGLLVQLSTGPTPAIDRLVKGDAPAAVLAVLSANASRELPEIAGYRIFQIPLSPPP